MEVKSISSFSDALPDRDTVERMAQGAHEMVDKVAAKAGPAVERVRTAAADASDTLQSKIGTLGDMEAEWVESARTYVRDNPLTAIGIGLLAGFVISRVTR